ncbi:InlB B-repeat-containing protein [Bifidobacterium sp. ESL0763]|uniref:leucine-rich repeat domain-containing protein n=1 Tax=Bifidobacterium sp. ESL0763 TaxID=2983227 RepID=UPI0023F909DC|nr:leucine-rich repeat domain-containing protein [Bifidobacterium sp. ESL0763]MDF7664274.1 InlB B-repeat-containing protein [Bifidobacterium sp. ESL0763]
MAWLRDAVSRGCRRIHEARGKVLSALIALVAAVSMMVPQVAMAVGLPADASPSRSKAVTGQETARNRRVRQPLSEERGDQSGSAGPRSTCTVGSSTIADCFPDPGVQAHISQVVNGATSPSDVFTQAMVDSTTDVSPGPIGATSLEGFQYLTHLETISLGHNAISDLTPLEHLTSLKTIGLENDQVSDLRPLEHLTGLQGLGLANNRVSDLTPLAGLTNLTKLVLNGNANGTSNTISDLTPLAGLTSLRNLMLDGNRISDLRPLSGLTHLNLLSLSNNQILDFSPLSGIAHIEDYLYADNQTVSLDATADRPIKVPAAKNVDGSDVTDISGITPAGGRYDAGSHTVEWQYAPGMTEASYAFANSGAGLSGTVTQKVKPIVSFDANGGTGGNLPAPTDHDSGSALTAPVQADLPTPPNHYYFDGTWEHKVGSGAWNSGWLSTMPSDDVTFRPHLVGNDHTLHFDLNGWGAGTAPDDLQVHYADTVASGPSLAAWTGHTLDGWQYRDRSNNLVDWTFGAGGTTVPDSDVTMYAKWHVNQHYLSYDISGGTGGSLPTGQVRHGYGDALAAPTTGMPDGPTGHSFDHWEYKVGASGSWQSGFPASMPDDDVTARIVWKVNQYDVTFDLNHGDGSVPVQHVDYLGHATKPTSDPSRAGYRFVGWFEAGASTPYDFTGTPVTADITLQARWELVPAGVGTRGNAGGEGSLSATGASIVPPAIIAACASILAIGVGVMRWRRRPDRSR